MSRRTENGMDGEAVQAPLGELFDGAISDKLLMEKFLNLVENSRDKEILTRYYINGETEEEIGKSMGVSKHRINSLRTSALLDLKYSDLGRQVAGWFYRQRSPKK